MPKNQPPRRENIINLIALFKRFNPLVNEIGVITGFSLKSGERDPTRDEFLHHIGRAIQDILSFIHNFDTSKANQAELKVDAMLAHSELQKLGIQVSSLAEGFEKVVGRHRQALDLILSISEMDQMGDKAGSFDLAQKRCSEFLSHIKRNSSVNENEPAAIPLPTEQKNQDSGTPKAQEGD